MHVFYAQNYVDTTLRQLAQAAIAGASTNRYKLALKHWRHFTKNKVVREVTPAMLEAYVAYRFKYSGIAYSTLAVELSAIHAMASQSRMAYPSEPALQHLRLVSRGFRRLRPAFNGKTAFPAEHMRNYIADAVAEYGASDYNTALVTAILAVAFRGMMRVSEYAAPRKGGRPPVILGQVRCGAAEAIIGFAKSKMNQHGRAERVALVCACSTGICGLHRLAKYLELRKNATAGQALFAFEDGTVVTAAHVRRMVKTAAQQCGLNQKFYSAHSLRSGGATSLFETGVPLRLVEQLGRWAPDSKALREAYLQVGTLRAAQLAFANGNV